MVLELSAIIRFVKGNFDKPLFIEVIFQSKMPKIPKFFDFLTDFLALSDCELFWAAGWVFFTIFNIL